MYQAAAVALAIEALPGILREQGISAASTATVVPAALITATEPLVTMLDKLDTKTRLERFVKTIVTDAARTTRTTDAATRPAVTGHVRTLRLPSCYRCVVLAGRVYRYSEGFNRHPGDDCLMTPTTHAAGAHLVTYPRDALKRGMVTGLSKADTEALDAGADFSQVVNVRRKAAGLTMGGSVIQRGNRLTPEGCLMLSKDKTQAVALLRQHGYVT